MSGAKLCSTAPPSVHQIGLQCNALPTRDTSNLYEVSGLLQQENNTPLFISDTYPLIFY